MNYKITLLLLCFGFFSTKTYSQEETFNQLKYTETNKGKVFFYWGGNQGSFSNSDITFNGEGYNFTLHNINAHDKPKGYHIDYINPGRMTIPQTNFRVGYFITEKYNISIGVDHMKYVATQNQQTTISGSINLPDSEVGSIFNGEYNNDDIILSENFLQFEHTDGLNYVNVEFGRMDDISKIFKIQNTDVFQINLIEAIAGGDFSKN